jgi:hypothetical protein
MLPKVPGAMGNNPMPKPVVKNKDGLEKTFFNLIFILFHQLLKIRLISIIKQVHI